VNNYPLTATVWKGKKSNTTDKHFTRKAPSEFAARRSLLQELIGMGYVVVKIEIQYAEA
jgi:hypothetical protein